MVENLHSSLGVHAYCRYWDLVWNIAGSSGTTGFDDRLVPFPFFFFIRIVLLSLNEMYAFQ